MTHVPSVDRRFFLNTVETLSRFGVDLAALCARHGIANPVDEPGERIPLARVSPVYDLVAADTGNPEFIYPLAQLASPEGAGTIFQLVSCCATLLDSLRLVCRYSSIASDVVTYSFHERGHHVDLLLAASRDTYVSVHQLEAAAYLPALQYRRLVPVTRGPLLQEVFFAHAARFPAARYEAYFGCPVRFGQQRNGARLNREALDTPLPGADERLQAYYRTMAERYEGSIGAGNSLASRVQRLFVQRMAFGEPDREDIARALNTSVRTLQRQLRGEGCSYRDIVEAARLAAARRELDDVTRPVHEVAFLLGYSDVRAFRRAFQRWTGQAPADYRRAART